LRVLFACDAGPEIGGGHVMRCLTLAEALTKLGAACAFLDTHAAAPLLDAFGTHDIERVNDAQAWGSDWVVLDNYRTTLAEEKGWRAGSRLAVIDDLARPHAADLVIDPSFGRDAAAYAPIAALTGPSHALVRSGFADRRAEALARRGGPVRRALIAFGLTDVGGVTQAALDVLAPLRSGVAFDVVAGAGAVSLPRLRALAAAGEIDLHVDVRDMATLSAQADIAVGAGGGSIWERAVLGLPTIALCLADNQVEMTGALGAKGALLATDRAGLGAAWIRLLADADLRSSLSKISAALCDGLGAQRVAQALMTPTNA
jgi:UDP-2,4-diacetamido-2,4,6-trideoxy-beta-L-altropyranose hydrolase